VTLLEPGDKRLARAGPDVPPAYYLGENPPVHSVRGQHAAAFMLEQCLGIRAFISPREGAVPAVVYCREQPDDAARQREVLAVPLHDLILLSKQDVDLLIAALGGGNCFAEVLFECALDYAFPQNAGASGRRPAAFASAPSPPPQPAPTTTQKLSSNPARAPVESQAVGASAARGTPTSGRPLSERSWSAPAPVSRLGALRRQLGPGPHARARRRPRLTALPAHAP
jgi:hypothetical protein